jgi:hypothetical protein
MERSDAPTIAAAIAATAAPTPAWATDRAIDIAMPACIRQPTPAFVKERARVLRCGRARSRTTSRSPSGRATRARFVQRFRSSAPSLTGRGCETGGGAAVSFAVLHSNSNDHDSHAWSPNVRRLPGIAAVSAGQAQIRRLPGPIGGSRPTPRKRRDPAATRLRGRWRDPDSNRGPRFSVVEANLSNSGVIPANLGFSRSTGAGWIVANCIRFFWVWALIRLSVPNGGPSTLRGWDRVARAWS